MVEPAAAAALAHFRAALPEVAALYAVLGCDAVDQERWLTENPAATICKRPGQRLRRAAMAERLRALAAEASAPLAVAEGSTGPAGAPVRNSDESAVAAGACAGHPAAAQLAPASSAAAAPATLTAVSHEMQTASPSEPVASPGPSGAPGAAGASAVAQGTAAPADSGAVALHPVEAATVHVPNGAAAAGQQKPGAGARAKKRRKREAEAAGADVAEPPAVGVQAARRARLKGQVEAALRALAVGLPGAVPWPLHDIRGVIARDGGAPNQPPLRFVLSFNFL